MNRALQMITHTNCALAAFGFMVACCCLCLKPTARMLAKVSDKALTCNNA